MGGLMLKKTVLRQNVTIAARLNIYCHWLASPRKLCWFLAALQTVSILLSQHSPMLEGQ